jgi:hypothetical protein
MGPTGLQMVCTTSPAPAFAGVSPARMHGMTERTATTG